MARILVTGAAGFIGRALCRGLVERRHSVLGATRKPGEAVAGAELRAIGDIRPQTDWSEHLDGVGIVVHLAHRAHQSADERVGEDEAAAAALARAAAAAGVRRLVHMSSVRAMGDATTPGAPFRCTDQPLPRDPYGRDKLAIEHGLRAAVRQTDLELVILRPPLVYGPGVKANFRALMRLVASGLPLPLAAVDNRRSLIFLDNLVDLTIRACEHPLAPACVLLARDAIDLSTPDLIRILAAGLDRPARLFAVPQCSLAPLRRLPRLGPLIGRLTLSLQVEDTETRRLLDWRPPISAESGLTATAHTFRERS